MNKTITICSLGFLTGAILTVPISAQAANIVFNGNFSAGNTGFSSDYAYGPSNAYNPSKNPSDWLPEGVYTVGKNPKDVHGLWSSFGDRTNTGNMMIVNGATTPGKTAWSQIITVTPNSTYNFAVWIASLFPDAPAQLQFAINSSLIGPIFTPSPTPGQWGQFNAIWKSGSNTSANISIVNQNTIYQGNDFALDDISFESVPATDVPEPTTALGWLTAGTFGAWMRNRKNKQKQASSVASDI